MGYAGAGGVFLLEGVSKLSEGLGKVAESIWEGSRKRRTAHGTGCSESGSIMFLVETGES